MNQNVRFYGLMVAVALAIGILWYAVRPSDTPAPPEEQVHTALSETPVRERLEAPEITSTHRPSRLTATASRAHGPRETQTAVRTGTSAISGQVTLADENSPVQGAEVSMYWSDPKAAVPAYDEDTDWITTTNSHGLYRFDKLPDGGQYLIVAKKDDLAGVQAEFLRPTLRDTEDHVVDIVLTPHGAISGVVVNEQEEPIASALVALGQGRIGERDVYGGDLQTKSGPDGGFSLDYVRKGKWAVAARAEGYAVSESLEVPTDGPPIRIVLKAGASVSGTVVSGETTKPVPKVTVRITNGEPLNSTEAETDGNGEFTIPDLADGHYRVAIDRQPYILTGTPPSIGIANAASVKGLQLLVALGGVVTGRATDAVSGAPIVNLGFRVYHQGSGGRLDTEAATDEDGYYRLEGLPAGQYNIRRMWMAGYRHGENREDKPVTVALGQEVSGIDFAVQPGLYLRGRVVDRNGEPLASVFVQSSDENGGGEGETMQTDAKGRFVHRGFSPGAVISISAEKAGYSAPPIENAVFPDHDWNDLEIVMDTGGSVAGTVVDKTGTPLPDVYVVASPVNAPSAQTQSGYTRDAGAFKIMGLAAGRYRIAARPPRISRKEDSKAGLEVELGQGEEKTGLRVIADFEAGIKLAGRVVDSSNNPIAGANVIAHSSKSECFGEARTGPDGVFQIAGLDTGTYEIVVSHSDYSYGRKGPVEAPSANLTITLRGKGTIAGRVLDARSGQPVKTFSVAAISSDIGTVRPGTLWGGQTYVDEEGRFEVRAAEGVTSLVVEAQGYAPKVRKVDDVHEEKTISGVDIRLDAGGTVIGTVTDKQGTPLAGAAIWIGEPRTGGGRSPNTLTRADGTYTLDSLGPEPITLFAMLQDYAAERATTTPRSGDTVTVNFALGSGGAVEGTVRVNGKPATNYNVSIGYPQLTNGYHGNTNVDANGKYSFKGLPDGEASLTAYGDRPGPGGLSRQIQQSTQIVTGRTATLDFDITSGTAVLEGTVLREGQPVSNAQIALMFNEAGDNREFAGMQSDAKGEFRAQELPAGTGRVFVHVPNSRVSRSYDVELSNGQTTRIDVEVGTGVRLNGVVRSIPEGSGATLVVIRGRVEMPEDVHSIWKTYQDRIVTSTNTGPDGSFQMDGIEPGECTIFAMATVPGAGTETALVATQTLTLKEENERSIELTVR